MTRRVRAGVALALALFLAWFDPPMASAEVPLEVLYLTDYSASLHDYRAQAESLIDALESRANVHVTLVGKRQGDTLGTLDIPGFAAGYAAVIYNFCLAGEDGLERIANAITQTTQRGVPALLLHCAVHSFRVTSPSTTGGGDGSSSMPLEQRRAEWSGTHPGQPFPAWWQFLGVNSVSHDFARSLEVTKVTEHPITLGLPASFRITSDELYRTERDTGDLNVLYTVKNEPVAWTRRAGATSIFVTTLGHGLQTFKHATFQDLIARGLLWLTGRLSSQGQVAPGYAGNLHYDNYQNTVRCLPSDIIEPSSVAEVQLAVRRAIREGKRVKAVSLPTSNSNSRFICPEQGGLLLNLKNLNQVRGIDTRALTVTVDPGIRMHDLSAWLHERGYAVTTMPDYTGVSVAGGMATGAHNSSLGFANAIADLAVSMTVVDGAGQLRVLTGQELAVSAVHVGLLGVVVEVTLQIVFIDGGPRSRIDGWFLTWGASSLGDGGSA